MFVEKGEDCYGTKLYTILTEEGGEALGGVCLYTSMYDSDLGEDEAYVMWEAYGTAECFMLEADGCYSVEDAVSEEEALAKAKELGWG